MPVAAGMRGLLLRSRPADKGTTNALMDSIFFGDPEHKRMEVPRCSSIEWIYTNCKVRGREKNYV